MVWSKKKKNYETRKDTNYNPFTGKKQSIKTVPEGFPGGAVVENLPAKAGDTGLSPGLGRSHMPQSN